MRKRKKAKTGPPITRRGGQRVEIYVRPMTLLDALDRRCQAESRSRQEILLSLIAAGLAPQVVSG